MIRAVIPVVLIVVILACIIVVMITDFQNMAKCQAKGGIYHASKCLSPGSVINLG